ncbi:MAG: hypothetical protein CM15mV12_0360 [uncultured marine virus]|nr:MAG: hypothetical protein CM15mV12_0360 [uncultured marine virus]
MEFLGKQHGQEEFTDVTTKTRNKDLVIKVGWVNPVVVEDMLLEN